MQDSSPPPTSEQRAIDEARNIVQAAGVRILPGPFIGIWSDLDCRELRTALYILTLTSLPIKFLEANDVPIRYKVRWAPIREKSMSWAEWKAAALNRIFSIRGGGHPNITAKTVEHGGG